VRWTKRTDPRAVVSEEGGGATSAPYRRHYLENPNQAIRFSLTLQLRLVIVSRLTQEND